MVRSVVRLLVLALAFVALPVQVLSQSRKLLQAASCQTQIANYLAAQSSLSTVASAFGPLLQQIDFSRVPPTTIIVPTNRALTSSLNSIALLASLASSEDKLYGLATYFLIPGINTPQQLAALGSVPTYLQTYTGKPYALTFASSGSGVTVTDSETPTPAKATLNDLGTTICSLKLYSTDTLLLPASSASAIPSVDFSRFLSQLYASASMAPAPGPSAFAPQRAIAAASAPSGVSM